MEGAEVPASHDRLTENETPTRERAASRVRLSHAQTRTTVRLALAFLAAAASAALADDSRWLALHLLLAGGAVLAVSGVSLMLTVTWSAAPAPGDRWVGLQRACIAVGAAGVAAARRASLPDPFLGLAGTAYLVGLVLLGWLLLSTARRGTERRFDPAVAAYVAAVGAGVAGVGAGVWLATGSPPASVRSAHVVANLLGLVGLAVAGTLPFFAATVGRSKMSPVARPVRLLATLGWLVASLVATFVGLATGLEGVAAAGLGTYALGIVAVLATLPRPRLRQLRWSGPRLLALWAGSAWWVVAVAASAVDAAGAPAVLAGRWTAVLAVAGYGQILWGSLAYLLPMLRGGGHEKLGEGFAVTRSWPGFTAVNLAGLAIAVDVPSAVTVVALSVWAVDAGWRAARVGTARAARPDVA